MRTFLLHIIISFGLFACSERPAYLIDGRVASEAEVQGLDSSEVFSYEKLEKEESACFPSEDQGSVVPVVSVTTNYSETEAQRQRHALLNLILDLELKGEDVLIVRNGIISTAPEYESLRKISSHQLSNAMVMSESDSKTLYGSKGKKITLVINTF